MTDQPHQRRPRYSGKNPRRFEEKYKELRGDAETLQKVLAAGKTPAGAHRPIMVDEILEVLRPQPGELAVDATLGHGGHAAEILPRLQPGGRLLGLDIDPIEQPKTEARLRALGYGPATLLVRRSNFAGLAKALAAEGWAGADLVLADLGISSMQIDDPARGFSVKFDGPLDMRMNPERGITAAALLAKLGAEELMEMLSENADEPHAMRLAQALAGRSFSGTLSLRQAIRASVSDCREEEQELTVRRVFQALRIAVNDEFGALEAFLRQLPFALNAGGRVAILTFHSGEDRRVKKAFQAGLREGIYSSAAREVIRAGAEELRANPRSSSAKLRWAVRG